MHKTFIIAEAGVNHNGSIDLAKKLIDVAVDAGADAVKFQTFKTEKNISKKAPKAAYQIEQTGKVESQREMVKKLELDDAAHFELADYARKKGIKFMSTGFDLESMDLLFKLGVDILKIPSGDVANGPLILKIAQAKLPIIFSTGMCTLGDIEESLGLIAFGYLGWKNPSLENFRAAYFSEEGRAKLKENVTLLHCTSEYPTPLVDVNLRAMNTLHQAFGLPVGYSDHTAGITVPIAATALGAVVIEKHFTLDKNMPGPDHQASLEPHELKAMVQDIRDVEIALGSSIKFLTKSDQKNAPIGKKSLVAGKDIKKGDVFTEENIGNMRPGTGISPMHYWELIGKKALNDYNEEDLIQFSEIAKII